MGDVDPEMFGCKTPMMAALHRRLPLGRKGDIHERHEDSTQLLNGQGLTDPHFTYDSEASSRIFLVTAHCETSEREVGALFICVASGTG